MSLFQTDKTALMRFVLDRYRVKYNPTKMGWQKISCFYEYMHKHGDKNPSASVNLQYGYMNCHGCGKQGDGYAALKDLEGWDVKQVNAAFGGEVVDEDEDVWI